MSIAFTCVYMSYMYIRIVHSFQRRDNFIGLTGYVLITLRHAPSTPVVQVSGSVRVCVCCVCLYVGTWGIYIVHTCTCMYLAIK